MCKREKENKRERDREMERHGSGVLRSPYLKSVVNCQEVRGDEAGQLTQTIYSSVPAQC